MRGASDDFIDSAGVLSKQQASGPGTTTEALTSRNWASLSVAGQSEIQNETVAALFNRVALGDQVAWRELVSRFGGMIASVGRRYGLSAADVAELQQTTWLRLVENIGRIEHPERVGGWLATTARRESLQLLRRASRYSLGMDHVMTNLPDGNTTQVDAGPLTEERDAALHAAWGKLKPRCRELLSLLFVDEPMGYKDLSTLLSMPVGSIGPTRARCLEHLRRLVGNEGLSEL